MIFLTIRFIELLETNTFEIVSIVRL